MKRDHLAVFVSIVALLTTGCVHPASQAGASTPIQKRPSETIVFPRQTLIFKPTRPDFTVGDVIFNFYCSNPDAVRVNGVKPERTWRQVHLASAGDIVIDENGIARGRDATWMFIHLTPVSTNQFALGPLKIEFFRDKPSDCMCMSIKAWFNEVGNADDGLYYENLADRFDLVCYRTTQVTLPSEVDWQFRENRVATVDEFKDIISKPFVIRLNQQPLGEKRSR